MATLRALSGLRGLHVDRDRRMATLRALSGLQRVRAVGPISAAPSGNRTSL
ncbi:hypothetical protein HMPREF0208_04509 [Citrobacter koseri]|nr:hypothetical protein HMPREF0208_04509 [Citrobacter koseri]